MDVCEGLGYAHTAGIIHRDIKPSNVRILEDGTVKIMDFGIAKSMVSQSTLTQTGITLGTASYLAPEQIRGEALDARTDLFCLGVLAYELTSGQPFTGDHISTVLYKIMNEQPAPPSTLAPGLPRALDAIILKLLEKDRTRRYASCAEVKAELAAVLGGLSDAQRYDAAPVEDMDRTVATPSADTRPAPRAGSRRASSTRRSRPRRRSGPRREAPQTCVCAPRAAPRKSPRATAAHATESGPALRVFLSAAIVVLAGGGAFWLWTQKKAARPQPVGADASAAPTASGLRPRRPRRPRPPLPQRPFRPLRTSPVHAGLVFAASGPAAAIPAAGTGRGGAGAHGGAEAGGPVTVTFRSNQVASLTVDGKKQGSVLPAGTRLSVEPGKHTGGLRGSPGS